MGRAHGYRRRTRGLMSKPTRGAKGLSRLLHQYKIDDEVTIDISPTQAKGMPHRRFQGLVGRVERVSRRSLAVNVRVGGKVKKVVARLEHVKPFSGGAGANG